MKLVTKVMCILKQSPFVPEWRAGDQIAYITERGGYMPTDFIDVSLPQFSYSFVDAIKVTTYVNLEFETEFILEAVRQVTAPLDTFTNDIVNMFKIQVPDVDFSGYIPDDINVNVELDGTTDINGDEISLLKGKQKGFELIALMLAAKLQDVIMYVDSQKEVTLTNKEFIAYVNKNLASKSVSENPRMNDIRHLWEEVNAFTYSKENKIIEELIKNKDGKFSALGDIISTEIQKTQELRQKVKHIGNPDFVTKVVFEKTDDMSAYQEKLQSYNDAFVESAVNLVRGGQENEAYESQIVSDGEELLAEVRGGLTSYRESFERPKLLAAEGDTTISTGEATSCSYSGENYKYTYE